MARLPKLSNEALAQSTRWARTAMHSVAFRLFIVVFLSYAYFNPSGGHNEAARFDTIRAVLHDGTFIIDRYVYNSADVIMVDGHYYSSKAPGTFLLGLVPFAVFDGITRLLPITEDLRWHLVCYLTSLFTIGLLGALCAPLIYTYLRRHQARSADAILIAIAISLGTILFPFSTIFFSHAGAAGLVFLGFHQLHGFLYQLREPSLQPRSRARLWLAGIALGFSISLEYPAAIVVALVLFYALLAWPKERRWSDALAVALAVVAGIIPMIIHNVLSFGKPFFIPYEAYANEANPAFEAHKHGILGIRIPFLEPAFWPQFLTNLAEITYRPLRGIFFANPVLLLIIPGFYVLLRRMIQLRGGRPEERPEERIETLLLLGVTLALFAFNASYGDSVVYWGGGASFGPRHLIMLLPFLALPLYRAIAGQRLRIVFAPLVGLSVFFCLIATAVDPRAPYEPNNVVFDWYLPRFLKGDFAINTGGIFSNAFVTRDSVAFNLGHFLMLPERFQLIPLYLFWLLGVWSIGRRVPLSDLKRGVVALVVITTAVAILGGA